MEQMRLGFEMALKNKLAQKTSSFQTEETVLMKSFRHFDTDADGFVNMNEWFKGVEKIGVVVPTLEDLKQLFAYYDTDKDGKMDYREFSDAIFRRRPATVQATPAVQASPEPAVEEHLQYVLSPCIRTKLKG